MTCPHNPLVQHRFAAEQAHHSLFEEIALMLHFGRTWAVIWQDYTALEPDEGDRDGYRSRRPTYESLDEIQSDFATWDYSDPHVVETILDDRREQAEIMEFDQLRAGR